MPKKIILVDDSKTILTTAQMAIQELVDDGIVIFKTYTNPTELLHNLVNGNENYDLLISDVNMPQLNGLDLAQELKQNDTFKNKPIVILTTENSAEMKAKGKNIGVTGWFIKPFSDEKLVKSIKMVLGI